MLCRWVLSVKKNYRPVKYHNWRHALNVAQTMFAMLKTGKMERFMTDLEVSDGRGRWADGSGASRQHAGSDPLFGERAGIV